jgi:hypothetical protein
MLLILSGNQMSGNPRTSAPAIGPPTLWGMLSVAARHNHKAATNRLATREMMPDFDMGDHASRLSRPNHATFHLTASAPEQ